MKKRAWQGGIVMTHVPRLWGCGSRVKSEGSSRVKGTAGRGLKAAREEVKKIPGSRCISEEGVWGYTVPVSKGAARVRALRKGAGRNEVGPRTVWEAAFAGVIGLRETRAEWS